MPNRLKTKIKEVKALLRGEPSKQDNATMINALNSHLKVKTNLINALNSHLKVKTDLLQQKGSLVIDFEGVCPSLTSDEKEQFIRKLINLLYPKILTTFRFDHLDYSTGVPRVDYTAEKITINLITSDISLINLLQTNEVAKLLNLDGLKLTLEAISTNFVGEVKKSTRIALDCNHDHDGNFIPLNPNYPHLFLVHFRSQDY